MPTLRITTQIHQSFSWRRPWVYISALSILGAVGLVFALVPRSVVSINPTTVQADPGFATANMLASFNAQTATIQFSDEVTHSYLAGHGAIFGIAGDNIQIFEYADSATAREEAFAIFNRVPWLASKSYFHVFLSGNLIGLYIGSDPTVLQIAEEKMGSPLADPKI